MTTNTHRQREKEREGDSGSSLVFTTVFAAAGVLPTYQLINMQRPLAVLFPLQIHWLTPPFTTRFYGPGFLTDDRQPP